MSLHQGIAHHQSGNLAEAERCYRQVLAANPNDPDALHLLGVIAYQVKQWRPAIELISRAIALNPSAAIYHNNLGNALRGASEREPASAAYERAIQLQPTYAEAHANLGTIRRDQARFADAVACYEQCLKLDPNLAQAHGDLATALKDQGRVEEAIAHYRTAVAQDPRQVESHSHLLYALHASDQMTPQALFQEHQNWGKLHAGRFAPPSAGEVSPFSPLPPGEGRVRASTENRESSGLRPHPNLLPEGEGTGKPLRVGFVSPDFRDHPVARFLRPILEHRDRTPSSNLKSEISNSRFEFIAYSSVDRPDAVTDHLRTQFDEFYDVAALTNNQLADVIRQQHGVDILIDLAGHTGGSRMPLFALKPAPVQITYLGYPNTSGIPQMDFRITDAIADPIGVADPLHTEKLLRLEGCFLAYTLLDDLPPMTQPAPRRGVTFGSFNNLAKISPTTIRLWTRVLEAVPDSRLIIKTTSLGDPPTLDLARERFASEGLPIDRVELRGPDRTQVGHLSQYHDIDIALDTFPYNGTTTTCEALSMGIPVVSLHGSHHASRVSLSLLTAAGFQQWASDDPDGFVAIARDLATRGDRPSRQALRDRLRRSRLCDGAALAREFDRALRGAACSILPRR